MLEKANEFRLKAEIINKQQSNTDDFTRITHHVTSIRTALQNLDRAMAVARRVNELPDAPMLDLDIDDGYPDFVRKIDANDFRDPVFRAAVRKLDAATARVDADGQQAWKTWSAQRLDNLPTERVALLTAAERKGLIDRRTRLERAANGRVTAGDITEFQNTYSILQEQLDNLAELSPELVNLLERLSQKKPLTIADLSDDELRILRESEVGAQIELRRRDS